MPKLRPRAKRLQPWKMPLTRPVLMVYQWNASTDDLSGLVGWATSACGDCHLNLCISMLALPDVPFFWFARVTLSQWLHFCVSITHPWNLLLPTSFRCFRPACHCQCRMGALYAASCGYFLQMWGCQRWPNLGTTFLGLHLAWAIWSRKSHRWSFWDNCCPLRVARG